VTGRLDADGSGAMDQPLTPEVLIYAWKQPGDPQISPDGSRIVYTLTEVDPDTKKTSSHLWLCRVDGSEPRRLTWSGQRNGGARWSPDGRSLAFVSDRVEKSGIFVLPLDEGGEAREVTRHRQPVSGLAWSPDGRQIAYVTTFDPENPNEEEPPKDAAPRVRVTRRIDYKQDGRGYLGDARQQVFVVDIESGERRRLTDEPLDHELPQWSPDGRWIAARRLRLNGMFSQLVLVPVDGGEPRVIGPETGAIGAWAWSPGGDRILYAGDLEKSWHHDLFLYELASDTSRRLTDDLPCLVEVYASSQPVWLDGERVLFHAFRAGASGLYRIDVTTRAVEQLEYGPSLRSGLSVDRAGRYVVQAYSSLDAGDEISVFDRETGETRLVTSWNQALLEEHPPARWERFEVRRDEFTIEAWLLFPPDFDPAKRYPLVLAIHGGPNSFYGYGFDPTRELLATNGFLVVYSNPRGSTSYGRRFAQQVRRDWGGQDYLDLMAVIDAVLERPYADPDRLGVWGYSYGGYMTAWIIGQTDRFKAAVCGAPAFDLESMYGTSDISHVFGELQWGGPPHAEREWYEAHSPSTFAHRARTPTLIVHGEADERCPIGQGEQMFVALVKAGCEVEFVRYPGGSHGMLREGPPEHRHDFLTRILDWFRSHLDGPA
jgi:dipeptidyl aminopeptidase/acylaminoacyl peptidase